MTLSKKRKKKSGNKINNVTLVINLITAILSLVTTLLLLIEKLTK